MDEIVAATAEELGAVSEALGDVPHRTFVIGVGLVEAALRLGAHLAHSPRPTRLTFIGTAGAFAGSDLALEATVGAASAILLGAPESYLPAPMPAHVPATATYPLVEQVHVANPLAITASTRQAPGEGRWVENLEVFAVLRAGQEHGVPAGALLGISNHVGPDASAQWRAHGEAAMQRVRHSLRRALDS